MTNNNGLLETEKLELDTTALSNQFTKDVPTINNLILDGVTLFLSADLRPSTNMIKFLLDFGILKIKNQESRNELLKS